MKKRLLLLLCLSFVVNVFAQKEANVWYFGGNAGVDFNSGVPVALTNGALTTGEGCATICDKNGNLLFYTDGIKVWNRNHTQMPNGFGMQGDPSSTQSGIIMPNPGNKNKYYVFTVAAWGDPPGVRYSEVDMTLNGGLGDIIPGTKNTLVFTPSLEKIAAVRHANGLYYWLIGHGIGNKQYYAYLVNCNGIQPPVTSVGAMTGHKPGWGYLTASPDAKRVGCAMSDEGFEFLDFNNATGVLTNPVYLGNSVESYGLSFSPNGNVLYGSKINTGEIYQWNLLAGSTANIILSMVKLDTAKGTGIYKGGALQLGPDGKLYMTQFGQPYLSVINKPNVVGTGCDLQFDAVNLSGRVCQLGLPALIQSYFDSLNKTTVQHTNHCIGDQTDFSFSGGSLLDSVFWDFGDIASGAQNTSKALAPKHQFSGAGTFAVKLIRYISCVKDTTVANVVIYPLPVVSLPVDTIICGRPAVLQSSVAYGTTATYLWNTGNTSASISVTQPGKYWLQVTENGCPNADTVNINVFGSLSLDIKDTAVCFTDTPFTLRLPQPAGVHYLWSNGSTADSIVISRGAYWLTISIDNCVASDTFIVAVGEPPVVNAGNDTTICESVPLQIGQQIPRATYAWSTGESGPYINVNKTGNYIVTVTVGPCSTKDTIAVIAMPAPVVNLGPDSGLCERTSVILDAGNTGIKYLWSNGNTTRRDTISDIGTYWVTVTSEYHCIGSDTVTFKLKPLPIIKLGDDTVVCQSVELLVRPLYSVYEDGLLWSTGSTDRQIYVKESGTFAVYASNQCGTIGDTIRIKHIFCDIRIPNAFTPDGDGTNDILKVLGSIEAISNFSLSVYNRWGELLFTGYDKYSGWDGKQKGGDCMEGVYVYVLQYTIAGEPVFQKGNVTLIR